MKHHSSAHFAHAPVEVESRIAQLRHLLRLVDELAGRTAAAEETENSLAESARFAARYCDALPIVQRRFDAFAAETSAWSAAAVEALIDAGDSRSQAAAARLSDELREAIAKMLELLEA